MSDFDWLFALGDDYEPIADVTLPMRLADIDKKVMSVRKIDEGA